MPKSLLKSPCLQAAPDGKLLHRSSRRRPQQQHCARTTSTRVVWGIMISIRIVSFWLLLSVAHAFDQPDNENNNNNNLHLTSDNYYELTKSKTVFIKFYAPWCSFCKKLASDWDRLAAKWKDHSVGLVAEVDCTDQKKGGKELCQNFNIESFPTIMYGDPQDLEEYEGGRSFDEMDTFATEHLIPICSVDNMDLCDDDKKKELQAYMDMDEIALESLIEEEETKLEVAEQNFQKLVDKLTEQFHAAEADRQEAIDQVMQGDLGVMRQVLLARQALEKGSEKQKDDSSNEEL